MERKPHDYLHLVAPTDGRDDNKPMLCGLDWASLYYDQATSVEHVDMLREEDRPYPLCPNCDKVFCDHTAGKEYRIGYTVGNEQENAIRYFDELFTEAEAKQRVTEMRAIDERPGLRGAVINSNYFYERRPCPGCSSRGQLHERTCVEWQGWVTWTTHNRRDYTVRGRTREEAYEALQREAEKFAPHPLIQNLHPAIGARSGAEEQPAAATSGGNVAEDVAAEFANWGPGLRPFQREAFRNMHENAQELTVPRLPPGFGKARTEE